MLAQDEQIVLQKEQIQILRDEVARLKKQKGKPKISPSKMDEETDEADDSSEDSDKSGKRAGSSKRSKTAKLTIHRRIKITPVDLPLGSTLIDTSDWTVQDLVLKTENTLYQLETWRTPDGTLIKGELPSDALGHFGASLVRFVLYQHYQCHVTQPLILEQLREFGVDISSGKISQILTEGNDTFHEEKDEILRVGLDVSKYINVDDTGARHKGKNGYCTQIGSECFAWFASTNRKSRINFLELLRAGRQDYTINSSAIGYMREQGLPKKPLLELDSLGERCFADLKAWTEELGELGITSKRHVRIATEGALLGSVIDNSWNPALVILSDDAGQFNILLHALCWIHAERLIHKLVGFNDEQRVALDAVRGQFWDFYADLKRYKKKPTASFKNKLEQRFDAIFLEKTCFATLNRALERLHNNKSELLLVLDRPDIPLHNNAAENDIRDYVKKRKISGSTRSELGRLCRDSFASLKKTSRKLKVSFWAYLIDRLTGAQTIPRLPLIIRQKAKISSA